MYDLQRIGSLISSIQKYMNEIKGYSVKSADDLADSKNYNASSMVVFAILNKVIDLGNEIISAEELGAPNTYQDIMPILAKANIINKLQAEKLNKLIRKRNVLAHFYDEMSEKDLFDAIKEIPLIEDFIVIVKKRVKLQ